MRIEIIPQIQLGSIQRVRVGDVLNASIGDPRTKKFRFAVAYVRLSGIERLGAAIDSLLNRRGSIEGAVGIDDGITTVEALEAIRGLSKTSTIFHTVSGYIYHPKLYLITGENSAVAIVGSPNLTRDGLYRNVEFASAVHMDFTDSNDLVVFQRYDAFINEFLDISHPNVKPINSRTIRSLLKARIINRESGVPEPGVPLRPRRPSGLGSSGSLINSMFPKIAVPSPPPGYRPTIIKQIIVPPSLGVGISTFVMQLSAFDSSHRTGVPGTPEVLVPHAAIGFFPRLARSERKYPDALFDVVLNTPNGRERHQYRLWYYEQRAVGSKIDEYRLRLNHDTIDLCTVGGGDLLVINRLPPRSDPAYEVTVLTQADPTFPSFLAICGREAQGKKWGMT